MGMPSHHFMRIMCEACLFMTRAGPVNHPALQCVALVHGSLVRRRVFQLEDMTCTACWRYQADEYLMHLIKPHCWFQSQTQRCSGLC